MGNGKLSGAKCIKIFSFAVAPVFILGLSVLIILSLEVYRPRKTTMISNVEIKEYQWQTTTANFSVLLDLVITIHNPNHQSFKYDNATAYIWYYDEIVAKVPIQSSEVPSLRSRNVSTSIRLNYADLMKPAVQVHTRGVFGIDGGEVIFVSLATLVGKVRTFGSLRVNLTGSSYCKLVIPRPGEHVEGPFCYNHVSF